MRLIGLVGRVFANGPGDLGSIPGRFIPKTLKMVLDILLNTQQYKVRIESKVEQSRERRSAFSYILVQQLLKREPSGRPGLQSQTLFTYLKPYSCKQIICCRQEYLIQYNGKLSVSHQKQLLFTLLLLLLLFTLLLFTLLLLLFTLLHYLHCHCLQYYYCLHYYKQLLETRGSSRRG